MNALFLVLRRMRKPLIVLIGAYAIAVLGFVLIPGQDDQGRPWHMDFFHAFYFVSYMGSTIGFGEIPYPFTDAQRLWTTFSIYLTVIGWLYSIGAILTLMQDAALRRVLRHSAFERQVRALREPFYLVCGYGDTGGQLVQELAGRGLHAVVIDIDPGRIDALALTPLDQRVPGLAADASDPAILQSAGLTHPCCTGVIALTNQDAVNLKVAISTKLLNPRIPAICRAETNEVADNMASFGTDHIINPFEIFADRLRLALHSPGRYTLFEWLTSPIDTPLPEPALVPRGLWILCGYGRFGKAAERYLAYEGIESVVVELTPERTGAPEDAVQGRGTEAITLRAARIHEASAIIAGTDDDTDNLSIVMTARELNPRLFTVARQTQRQNDAIFEAASLNLVVRSGSLIARQVVALITNPLLSAFLRVVRHQDDAWAGQLVSRIAGVTGEATPDTWTLCIDAREAPALWAALQVGDMAPLGVLYADPQARNERLPCFALMVRRAGETIALPEENFRLAPGDYLLFCGELASAERMSWTARNENVLDYVLTGEERPSGSFWRWLAGNVPGR